MPVDEADNRRVIIEVLAIDGCRNAEEAVRRVRSALDQLGHADRPVEVRWIRTRADAEAVAFAGSPTITANGVDVFPSEGRTANLACRVYETPGGLAGLPTVDQIVERIHVNG